MRCTIRSLLSLAFTGALATSGWAGAIPSPFAEPETSRPPAARQAPAPPAPGDDIIKPSELPPMTGGAMEAIQRETLAPLDAPADPAPPDKEPGQPALTAPPGSANPPTAPPRPGLDQVADPTAPAGQPNPPPGKGDQSGMVVRNELSPVMAQDGSGLPYELWQGMTIADVEKAVATLDIPPRSPALLALFRRLITSNVPPPQGGVNDVRFTAVRVDALDRSGLIDEAAALMAGHGSQGDPVLALAAARTAIALGDRDGGCRNVQAINATKANLPVELKGQSILVRAYCAIAADQKESAELQVALARDEGVPESAGLVAIDAITTGSKPILFSGLKVGPVDWRILKLGGAADPTALIETAEPSLLSILARDQSIEPALRLAALERAAQFNAADATELAKAYRAFGGGASDVEGRAGQATRHAALFQAAQDEATPQKKARLIRSFLDDMRTAGLYWTALQIMARAAESLPRVPEIGWFTETAIETGLASGDFSSVRAWAEFGETLDGLGPGRHGYAHWLALADIADPGLTDGRARHLDAIQEQAARGRFTPEQLHRLVTVLDALQIQVPIPLWELASRTPQPETGFLPETGVLSALSAAAKKKEFGHTVLLAMQSLGPNGAEGAHIIALGDSIRALRSAGLDVDSRALALEALFMSWPRTTG